MQRQKRILVVDDEPDIIAFLQELLEQESYIVAITTRGERVEQHHGRELPDLILLDAFLSDKNGRDIVKHLKDQEETRHIPIIMFSAHPGAKKMAQEAGADDFMAKPFEIGALLTNIASHLGQGMNCD